MKPLAVLREPGTRPGCSQSRQRALRELPAPQFAFPLPFQMDHVLAEKHGGESVVWNLALACAHCNRFKGPNIAGLDRITGDLTRLYNPRQDRWTEHFQFEGPHLKGKTPMGRVTIDVLAMNAADLLRVRAELIAEEIFF